MFRSAMQMKTCAASALRGEACKVSEIFGFFAREANLPSFSPRTEIQIQTLSAANFSEEFIVARAAGPRVLLATASEEFAENDLGATSKREFHGAFVRVRTPMDASSKIQVDVYLERGPPAQTTHLLTHELAHIFLLETKVDPRHSRPLHTLSRLELTTIEGLCDYLAARFLLHSQTPGAAEYVSQMFASIDPIYGLGIRAVRKSVEAHQGRLDPVLNFVAKHRQLPYW